jgi:hypothetical protein
LDQLTPASHCPNCGQCLDSAEAISAGIIGLGVKNPQPGDITVCFYCCSIMAFDDQLALRNLTSQEMHEVAGDRRIVALINEIAAVKKEYQHGRRKPG